MSNKRSKSGASSPLVQNGEENPEAHPMKAMRMEGEVLFVSELPCEAIEFLWTLKNFQSLSYSMREKKLIIEVEFEAGYHIDLPSKWRFQISIVDSKKLCVFLHKPVMCNGSMADEAFAFYDTIIKNENCETFLKAVADPAAHVGVSEKMQTLLPSVDDLFAPGMGVLKDGHLTLQFQVQIYGQKKWTASAIQREMMFLRQRAEVGLNDNFKSLREKNIRGDLEIQTQDGKKFIIHSFVLAARSPEFLKKHTARPLIIVEDVGSEAMDVILNFIYTGQMLQGEEWKNVIQEVVSAADKYCLTVLKLYCDYKISEACTIDNAMKLLRMAQNQNFKCAVKEITNFIKAHLDDFLLLLDVD